MKEKKISPQKNEGDFFKKKLNKNREKESDITKYYIV